MFLLALVSLGLVGGVLSGEITGPEKLSSGMCSSGQILKKSGGGGTTWSCDTDDDDLVSFPTGKLSAPVTCEVSASYCTIFSVTPTASSGVALYAWILIDSDSTTVAPQFRVSSADAGYTGMCNWTAFQAAAATTTAPQYNNIAIGTAPADTADTSWGTTDPQTVEVRCSLLADASPGALVIEWQLETGTTPVQTVLDGSYYTMVTE